MSRIGLAAIGLIALALRAWHVSSLLASPIGRVLVLDAAYYHQQARRILEGGDFTGPGFMNFGYPYFLAGVYGLFGSSPSVALWCQAAADTVTAVLLGLIAWTLLDRRPAAFLAGALYACYAPALFYDGLVLTPSMTNAAIATALLGVALHLKRSSIRALIWAGAASGVAVLLRSNVVLMLAVLAPLVALRRSGGGRRLVPAATLVGIALLPPLSIIGYHGLVHGEWVPLSANGGMNFWTGNHRGADGSYSGGALVATQDPAEEARVFLDEARRRSGQPRMSLAGSSRFWFREGAREIVADPPAWLRLESRKLALFFSRHEAKTNVSMEFVAGFSHALWLPGFAWLGVLGSAGLGYLFVSGRRPAGALAVAPVFLALATCLLFFVSGEYRHPASLGLCLAAAAWIDAVVVQRERRTRWLAISLAVAVPAVVLGVRVDERAARAAHPFVDYSNYARAIVAPGPEGRRPSRDDFGRAVELLDHARSRDDREKVLFLLDARLWVHCIGALELNDRRMAAEALSAAEALLSQDLRVVRSRYSETFIDDLEPTIVIRVRALAALPLVARDAGLRERARKILARLEAPAS